MEIKPARETEYKGVVFRSMSEAVVARSLDLYGDMWEYEPPEFRLSDGWAPDFLVSSNRKNHIALFLIEYKPAKPTDTYKKELRKRFDCLKLREGYPCPIILYGSPFDITVVRGAEYYGFTDIWKEVDWSGVFDKWDEAKRYRFDLQAA